MNKKYSERSKSNSFFRKTTLFTTSVILAVAMCSSNINAQNTRNNPRNTSTSTNTARDSISTKVPKFYWGLFGGLNLNMQFANFDQILSDCPTCVKIDLKEYGFTTGFGFSFGGLFEYPFYDKVNGQIVKPADNISPMAIGLRFGYTDLSADYSIETPIGNILAANGNLMPATSKHTLENSISAINFSPYFSYKLSESLVGNVGLNFNYLLTHQFNQSEELLEPSGLVFDETGTRIRNKFDNQEIPNVNSLVAGINLGVGYHIPISSSVFLVPEIRYNFNFMDVSADLNWKTSALQFGVALKFPYTESEKKIVPQIFYQRDTTIEHKKGISAPQIVLASSVRNPASNDIDTIVTEKYIKYLPQIFDLTAGLKYYGIDKGRRLDVPTVTIEEFESRESFPILPIIYFPDGSADLQRTKMQQLSGNQINRFSEENLNSNIFEIYHHTLNVIAKRLRENPRAQIIIAGYSSGFGLDKQDEVIWQKRASVVRDYFVDVWKVDVRQIRIEQRDPETREEASLSFSDVVAENQKVQIFTRDLQLLRPITLSEIEKIANPPQIGFEITASSENGLESYSLVLSHGNAEIRNFSSDTLNSAEKLNEQILWNIAVEPIPVLEEVVNATLIVKDKQQQTQRVSDRINIVQRTIKHKRDLIIDDMKINRYSLILFDIDKADVTDLQEEILKEVKNDIQPNSRLFISGYADRTGNVAYNEQLARRRCENVNRIINPGNRLNVTLDVVGSSRLLYENDSPEGRAFSRTVIIEIHTPIK